MGIAALPAGTRYPIAGVACLDAGTQTLSGCFRTGEIERRGDAGVVVVGLERV